MSYKREGGAKVEVEQNGGKDYAWKGEAHARSVAREYHEGSEGV
jgi:hypothetical protein